jgi:catechol 2,3-dioxygenase-like lactoylglutathione lyase family enzyme
MDLNHLHLHVRDLAKARAFYERYFAFREHVLHGNILFLRNADGFDLALAPAEGTGEFPHWFHFGFRLSSPEAVRAMHGRMSADRVPIAKPLHDDPEFVSYRCLDPEGHAIEVYWE